VHRRRAGHRHDLRAGLNLAALTTKPGFRQRYIDDADHGQDSSVAIDYKDARLADPVNAVTVLRAKLDAWLAEKCEDAGAMIMPGVRVDCVLTEGTRVVGVQAAGDELRAHVVVAADGVKRLLVACCPAHVYTEEPDGTISVEYAACLECGTCLAIAAPGALKWHYPRGGFGVQFREG
jgi:ferredoxin-like protein FixX